VQRRVTEFMGKSPCKGVNADEAVGIGAAIMSHSLAASDDVTLLDVLPMPIGISKPDGTMQVLFPKNQPLPDYKKCTLTTSKDNQKSILLRLYQGDSKLCAENELLGTFVFSGIRPERKGKVRIEVTLHIDSEGILNLTARDKNTGQTVEGTLKLGKAGEEKPTKSQSDPTTPPPLPLTMPQSMLAAQIGSMDDVSDRPTMMGSSKSSMLFDPPPADHRRPEAPSQPTPPSSPSIASPKIEPPQAPKIEPPPPASNEAPASVWGKITGWFKSLFG